VAAGVWVSQRADPTDMVDDVELGGGDDPDRLEGPLQGMDTENLDGQCSADAADIENHQAVVLIRDEIRLSKATPWDWMNHVTPAEG